MLRFSLYNFCCFSVYTALVIALGFTANSTSAQTPLTTIENEGGDVRFQLNDDGGLLVPGTSRPENPNNSSIPATGSGTRMMWFPSKAAFRAGKVGLKRDGAQWNPSKVGFYSTAFGVDTEASADAATAMGRQTTASGKSATAMGRETTAEGPRATAMGWKTTADGISSTAMGRSTKASGATTTAMGFGTTASGTLAIAMGDETTASGNTATAMGERTIASSPTSLSIGSYNQANRLVDGTLFVVGNGNSRTRSDAMRLDENGNLTISGRLNQNSDRRLKTDIQSLGDSILSKLTELRPVRYEFRNQQTHPSGQHIGLLAQDVRKEFPRLVSEGAGGYLSLAYPKLSAVLVKGLQEQQAQIERQKTQLAEKEEQIDQLRAQQQEIEQRLTALESSTPSRAAGWAGALPIGGMGILIIGGLLGASLLHLYRR